MAWPLSPTCPTTSPPTSPLAFSASGVSGTNSSTIAVSPAAAAQLVFITQPGSTTYGSALSPQPVLKTRDSFGNDSTVGLGASQLVTLSVSAGTGSLLGTASLDIGTAAGNGTVSFAGLQVSMAGTGKQLSASAAAIPTSALSSSFNVNQATVTGSITANNKIYDGTTAATIATRALSGALAGDDVSLSGGTASFASKSVGTARTVTATGLTPQRRRRRQLSTGFDQRHGRWPTSPRALADVSATGVNKAYDGTTQRRPSPCPITAWPATALTTSYTSASFADKNVGTAKTGQLSAVSRSAAPMRPTTRPIPPPAPPPTSPPAR